MPKRGRPSHTAAKVARMFVFAGRYTRYAPLLPSGAAELTEQLLVETGAMTPWMQRFYASPRNRARLEHFAERFGPGQLARMALRKRFMDDEIRAALAAGATQVLVIGAGYDTACMRLAAEFEDRLFVEIDHPATHERKRAGVETLGRARANYRLLAADLGETTLVEALARLDQPAWDAEARTIVIAEGLIMYLDRDDVVRLFAAIHELTGPGSRVAFSYMKCDAHGRPYAGKVVSGITRLSLKLLGEALRFCVADERELAELLEPLGWRYRPDPGRFDLGTRYLAPAGFDDRDRADVFEFMAVVDRAG
ncbi:MAG TPA: SAM-dependent methyltransferase [Enhygromyxa sp.]|nr:SAM-dependent methyltransferase [Enhygromyxa sp.]